ncbi:hypothetical protein [Xanthomonas euvesicatoria]|uniref:hypothetical protein n=1 Tax=Xanthomonas euvesicatoria TaxID=456327 RepID=UPI001C442B64|nr:hypothetical protein [Xanthomonas euvesicatoria]MBV6831151.1 hypothetical protein [Xanthomonas campestris pv. viegasii]MEB2231713.1 hypothetical protein [Xanthomonas campestris pv. campestris]
MDTDNRLLFLKRVYDEASGDQTKQVNAATIASVLDMDEQDLRKVTHYLAGEHLIVASVVLHSIPTFVTITHAGIKAVEAGTL